MREQKPDNVCSTDRATTPREEHSEGRKEGEGLKLWWLQSSDNEMTVTWREEVTLTASQGIVEVSINITI